ncbi:MAG TPA: phytoene desaturase [Spirochaetia bacterium]|nr:phytoene desaturase [Spirochaetia bacterium]
MAKKKVVMIGAGLAGLAGAALLARNGSEVTVVEQLDSPGGVAGRHTEAGFTFDTGPSWYLMNGVYERFFGLFGKKPADYYDLVKLEPSYRIFFGDGTTADVTTDPQATEALFERLEPEGGKKIRRFLKNSALKYRIAVDRFIYREYRSMLPFLNPALLFSGLRLDIFSKLDSFVGRYFKDPRSRQIVEFNTVFLGSSPYRTPALFSLMAHADITEGVSFPRGGVYELVKALHALCLEQGVRFKFKTPVEKIVIEKGRAAGVATSAGFIPADVVVAGTDYHHADTALVDDRYRNYSARYWKTRVIAPATFLILLGLDRPVPGLAHHNFYFASDWKRHFDSIFDRPSWPDDPSYYVGVVSKTAPAMAPAGGENLFILVPVAPGLPDTDAIRASFSRAIISHVSKVIGVPLEKHIAVKKIIAHRDFEETLHYYKGTGLGLSHTLFQTALFRPARRHRRVKNLYYTGHYTQPGIGMPMAVIGSELLAARVTREMGLGRGGG